MSNLASVLVTGDIVTDVHLYIAPPDLARATVLASQVGGAQLTLDIIRAAHVKHAREAALKKAKTDRLDEAATKTAVDAALHSAAAEALSLLQLGLAPGDKSNTAQPQMLALASYGVWAPHPANLDTPKPQSPVWRVSANGGYGSAAPDVLPWTVKDPTAQPEIVVIDEGALAFRHTAAKGLWPDLKAARHVLLKHSSPLCRGELWSELLKVCADRLTVIVSANDLRREDALISRRLSWEQTAIDTLRVLNEHPLLRELKRAATLIVVYRGAGALLLRGQLQGTDKRSATLTLRASEMEGEYEYPRQAHGSVYGFQTCMVGALAYRLWQASAEANVGDRTKLEEDGLLRGIESGLTARRILHERGHGAVAADAPGFPVDDIAEAIMTGARRLVQVSVPLDIWRTDCKGTSWSILGTQETFAYDNCAAMAGLAKQVVRYGQRALDNVPSLAIKPLFTVDRGEIESLRAIKRAIEEYESQKVQKKPLSIAVFGPPGAGKSFAVKAIAKAVLPGSELLEFNLSQFNDTHDLNGAFHQVRDSVLRGHTPVVFWDEFDSREYKWLQYLLAPMQDGAFQEERINHPIGKCVFVFAGGTSPTLERFGPPPLPTGEVGAEVMARDHMHALAAEHVKFRLLKGPDFLSRLHAYLNILGPNPRQTATGAVDTDCTFPIRRALMLRALLDARDAVLDLDAGLVHALLTVPEYLHGARSFEKILMAMRTKGENTLGRSALPARPVLQRDVDADAFLQLMTERDIYKTSIDIEHLADVFHSNYLAKAAAEGWFVQPRIEKPYAELDADAQSANRGSAQRVPELLELIDFRVEASLDPADLTWQDTLMNTIERHIERLGQAEHMGWIEERKANGWRVGTPRDDNRRIHPALEDWGRLTAVDQGKDRDNVRLIPKILQEAGYRAIPG